MTHLLGSKNCIDSLSKDVLSMQECIQAILAKTGQLEYASWKYPSKVASSLDISELVEDYEYCKLDEDSNRLSHIILFELIIDRFCLLLQSVSEMFESVVTEASSGEAFRPKSRTVTTTMSVGLVTKLFWNKICDIHLSFSSMEKEILEYNQSLMKMENVLLELTVENEKLKRKTPAKVKKKVEVEEELNITHGNNTQTYDEEEKGINTNNTTTFTQTYETAFVPCEICASMQENLMKIGTSVIDICESQGLPSSLSKQKKLLKNCQMTFTDITRWANEEERDLSKVNKHLSDLQEQIGSLQNQLSKVELTNSNLSNDIDAVTSERDKLKMVADRVELENEKQRKRIKESEESIETYKEDVIRLREENKNLQEMYNKHGEDLERYKQSSKVLEDGMNSLTSQLESQKGANVKLIEVERTLNETTLKMKENQENLNQSITECNKVKAENKVLLKHDQGLQVKQANLLSRIDKLDETCKDLVIQLGENEEEIEKLVDENTKKQDENKRLKEEKRSQLDQINELKNQLNNAIVEVSEELSSQTEMKTLSDELELLSQNLKLVVCYPVIGNDYESVEKEYTTVLNNPRHQINTDGDVLQDLENQIKANTARIGVLDAQNYKLRNSLLKLEQVNVDHNENVKKTQAEPVTVLNHAKEEGKKLRYSSAPSSSTIKESFVTPRPPSEPRASSKLTRPRSANKNEKKESFNIGAKLANLDRIKNASMVEKFDWTPTEVTTKTAWDVYTNENSRTPNNTDSFICPDCDKTYLSTRDLDIHKNFCYGKLFQ